jgi:D-3-phosphoglycerate dehydrogenase / 2-oxoglutarate reductase
VSARPKALVTAPFRGEGLRQLEEIADVVLDPWIEHRPMRIYGPEQLVERLTVEQADVLVCEADFVSGEVFDLALRAIASTRGDPTNVDVPGATAKGIPVLRAPGRNADGVAEMTVALMFAAVRHVVPADKDVREGEVFRDGTVPYQRFRAFEVNGRTAGLIGFGAIGRALKWRLEGLGMRVLAYDPYSDDATASLDEVLAESDVVSMHAAITPETFGMVNAELFARMKNGVIYLNAARADLHDMDALVECLRTGKVGAAGLDHFSGEQLPSDHPLIDIPNVVLTPHIGGATYNTEENHSRMIANDLALLFRGERPVNIVNPEVLG